MEPDPVTGADPPLEPEEEPSNTTVIEIGGEDGEAGRKSLLAAAQEAKESRKGQGPPVRVITDKNLSDHATGKLTEADPDLSSNSATTPVVRSTDGDERGEEYWRRGALDHRGRWREAVDEIARLEGAVADLRNRFYAEDDPYVRDGKIKPAWDRALDRLADAREEALQAELDLEAFLEEGRRAGALPGWLREGIHLEPERSADEMPDDQDPREHVVGEPVVVDEDGDRR
jgi:hypothetical protein